MMDGFVTETMLDESETEMRVSRPHGAPAFDELVARVPGEDLPAWEEGETAEDGEDAPEELTEEEGEDGEAAPAAEAEAATRTAGNYDEASLGRTDDPVRMFLREASRTELLTREQEVALAQRIEAGREAMLGALGACPATRAQLAAWRDAVAAGSCRCATWSSWRPWPPPPRRRPRARRARPPRARSTSGCGPRSWWPSTPP